MKTTLHLYDTEQKVRQNSLRKEWRLVEWSGRFALEQETCGMNINFLWMTEKLYFW